MTLVSSSAYRPVRAVVYFECDVDRWHQLSNEGETFLRSYKKEGAEILQAKQRLGAVDITDKMTKYVLIPYNGPLVQEILLSKAAAT